MGRLIDGDELLIHKTWINGPSGDSIYDVVFCDEIEEAPTVEAIPRAEYEARLTELRSMTLRVKHNTGSIDTLIDKLDDLLSEVQE